MKYEWGYTRALGLRKRLFAFAIIIVILVKKSVRLGTIKKNDGLTL